MHYHESTGILFYHDDAYFMTTKNGPIRHFGIRLKLQHLHSVTSLSYDMLNLGKGCLLVFKLPLPVLYIVHVHTVHHVNSMYLLTTFGVLKHITEVSVKT